MTSPTSRNATATMDALSCITKDKVRQCADDMFCWMDYEKFAPYERESSSGTPSLENLVKSGNSHGLAVAFSFLRLSDAGGTEYLLEIIAYGIVPNPKAFLLALDKYKGSIPELDMPKEIVLATADDYDIDDAKWKLIVAEYRRRYAAIKGVKGVDSNLQKRCLKILDDVMSRPVPGEEPPPSESLEK